MHKTCFYFVSCFFPFLLFAALDCVHGSYIDASLKLTCKTRTIEVSWLINKPELLSIYLFSQIAIGFYYEASILVFHFVTL